MPHFNPLPIMPKERKASIAGYAPVLAPYPITVTSTSATRNASIWNSADDEILLQARASGLNWGPIHQRHFPNKTPNACRKRHERLVEKRQGEDWDAPKLETLALEYAAVRREMWETLAVRLGEKWSLVEAKVSCVAPICLSVIAYLDTVHGERTQKSPHNCPDCAEEGGWCSGYRRGRTRYRPPQRLWYRLGLRC